ncbi:MAG: hypothetical protein ACE5Q3_07665 [Alphaproteobacteria bacterium]
MAIRRSDGQVASATALALWFLLGLFVLRVVGQALVAFLDVSFLPPMDAWYSGLLGYPWLLAAQVLIILLCARACLDFTRGEGFFVRPRRALGAPCLLFGSFYLGVMVCRYVIRMVAYPAERWTGGSLPTFLHWVLAAFILIVGTNHWRRSRPVSGGDRSPGSPWPRRVLALPVLVAAVGAMAWLGSRLAPLPPP